MKNMKKSTLKTLCLSLVILFPLATYAKPNGEIIFRHPVDVHEIWIGNVNEGRTSRRLFNPPLLVMGLSIQKGDRHILTVAERLADDELASFIDAYLLDRQNPRATEKNLTQGQYGEIIDADISPNGDIAFTNLPFQNGEAPSGLYLIPNHEREKPNPKAELLLQVEGGGVTWAPNGNEIAFSTAKGIFHFNIFTQQVEQIIKDGRSPVFSPSGKHIAFMTHTQPTKLGLISIANRRNLKHIELEDDGFPRYLCWSADGRYIVYTLQSHIFTYSNFAVPIDGGKAQQILQMYPDGGIPVFEWTNKAYAVEPTNRLTTLWGKLKR